MRDPKRWQDMAEEIRTCADSVKDEISKQQLINTADMYERLAIYAEYQLLKRVSRAKRREK